VEVVNSSHYCNAVGIGSELMFVRIYGKLQFSCYL
jgi:hypothetical protein